MDPMESQLRETYAREETENLVELSVRGGLTEVAERVLQEELAHRNVTSADITVEEQRLADVEARKIALQGQLASRTSRLVANLIDTLGTLLLITPFSFVAFVSMPEPISDLVARISIIAWFTYYFLKDGINGQSLGKRLLRIRVVDSVDGTPCNLATSIIRGVFGMLGLIDQLFALGESKQRLADHVAKTLVIKVRG